MKKLSALPRIPILAVILVAAMCLSSVFIPLSGAAWRQTLGIFGSISANPDLVAPDLNCTYPVMYWHDHPESWPVNLVSLGGVVYSQEQALPFLGITGDSPLLYMLRAQMLAARLNVSQGADPSIANPLIEEADLVLELSATAEAQQSLEMQHIALLAEALAYYNNGLAGPGLCPDPTPTATPIPTADSNTCTYPLSYWEANFESWSLDQIETGGIVYAPSDALNILKVDPVEDVILQLIQQLVATRLNLAAGADLGEWRASVDLSDNWLRQHPLGSPLSAGEQGEGLTFVTILEGIQSGAIGPGACPEASQLPESIATLVPTDTPTASPTETSRPSETPKPSDTPTPTLETTATATHTPTPTQSITPTHTITPTIVLTERATLTPTLTPTDEPPEEGCTYTQDFWVTHPEAWPEGDVLIAGERVENADLLALLQLSDETDVGLQLVQQLIVARLNQMQGADLSSVEEAILAADGWLSEHLLGSDLEENERNEAIALADHLEDYNHGKSGPGSCPVDPVADTPTPIATITSQEDAASTSLPEVTPTPTTSQISETPTEAATGDETPAPSSDPYP